MGICYYYHSKYSKHAFDLMTTIRRKAECLQNQAVLIFFFDAILTSTLHQVIFWHCECISSKVYPYPASLHILYFIFLISWEALTDIREEKI